ncbi:AMP-binding protein [Nocardia otitidiscaviarum]|uniref:AMP-binding protein n=1 Tax=Nocardia otitidiscaviarum TaxID=1823 RepID=UPI002457FECE|nr:AMP-binding protein [Nocardia otitidiscaviarum]
MDRRDESMGDTRLTSIPALFADRARQFPNVLAVAGPEGRMTYAELAEHALAVTRAAMASGLGPGDRVGIWAPNGARWIVTALGLLGAGAVLVPINTRLTGVETADVLARARARALFTVRGFLGNDYPRLLAESGRVLPTLRRTVDMSAAGEWRSFLESGSGTPAAAARARAAAVDAHAISDILFTSGTTGAPKGVLATHRQTLEVFDRWADAVTLRHGDRCLLVNPFSHTFGYKAGIIACLLRAATMIPVPRFDADAVLDLIARERVTMLAGAPTLFTDLLRRDRTGRDLSSLRLAGTGGAPVPAELVERIRSELGVPHVYTAYGLTESIGVVTVCPPDAPAELAAQTVGKAVLDTEIRLVDRDGAPVGAGVPGEITVRGPNVMRGYLDDREATAAAIDTDGWLHTGDVGTLDADGYLRVTDRLKDVFIVGGFNAYPAEIERTLLGHPGIRDVAVVGIPDPRLGEVGRAVVVPTDPAAADADAILGWARTRLAGYKVPREIAFTDALPRNTGGKVMKNLLRAPASRPE